MFALQLLCPAAQAERVSAELWDWNCLAISEEDRGDLVLLIAGFSCAGDQAILDARFAEFQPEWEEDSTDWEAQTRLAWQPRSIGRKLFLALPWSTEATPPGRVRLVHNPGAASGTGEHPCTQLVLESLESLVRPGVRIADIGTGSGILSMAACLLGGQCVALDTDVLALLSARDNFQRNQIVVPLIAGSADCLAPGWADIVLANISGTVLLSIWDDLLRVAKLGGWLILSGFVDSEASAFLSLLPQGRLSGRNEWRCLTVPLVSR